MQASFRFELTKDEYIVGLGTLMEALGAQDRTRSVMLWEQLGVIVLFLVGLIALFPGDATGIVVAIVALPVAEAWVRSRGIRRSTGASYDPAVAAAELQFSDSEISEQAAGRTRRWRWSEVRAIHDRGSALVFELAGWDMLVLPARLWRSDAEKQAFLRQARGLVPPAEAARVAVVGTEASRDMMLVGAIGAGADAFLLVSLLTPLSSDRTVVLVGLAFAAAAAFFGYRLARYALGALHAQSPRAAIVIAYVLVGLIPMYMIAAYMGWI